MPVVRVDPLLRRYARVLGAGLIAGLLFSSTASAVSLTVEAKPIPYFQISSYAQDFGPLRYMGGILTWSDQPLYGALSSIRFREDGETFVGVLDTGHFLTGRIERDGEGKLSGIADANIAAMLDSKGQEYARKYMVDAEGLSLRGSHAYVSFEQRHRIDVFDLDQLNAAKPIGSLPHLIPTSELRANGGIETLAQAPQDSPLKGALVAIAEQSVDQDGNLYAAILEGPLKGQFKVTKRDDFAVTDGTFLPNGDLLLLERRFNFAHGVGMRIRRVKAETIRPGALVDGELLLDAGMSYQIDNMEGIDAVQMPDGSTHLFVVSDNNHSFLQRNLMLEFKLLD